jgi:hypothetical protein
LSSGGCGLIKPKTNSQLFSISEVIVSSELSGKIDTSKWLNQANIVTPDFKKSSLFTNNNINSKVLKDHNFNQAPKNIFQV